MKPVTQSKVGAHGRCFPACVASILEVPESSVPGYEDTPDVYQWLERRGLRYAQASIEGTTYMLPAPFLVIATQNPIDFHGTYPLPEAQLDRFGVRINLGYPAKEVEVEILYSQFHHHPLDDVMPILD